MNGAAKGQGASGFMCLDGFEDMSVFTDYRVCWSP